MGKNEKPNPIIKAEYPELKSLNRLSVRELNLTLTPKHETEKVTATITNAVVSILGFNPITSYSVSEDTLVGDIKFNLSNKISRMQNVAIPLENYFVEKLLVCPKVPVRTEKMQYISNENINVTVNEDRILTLGIVDGNAVPIQLNFKTEFNTNGKPIKFSTNLGVILGGKTYFIIERYDQTSGHQNLFYDNRKNYTDSQQERFIHDPAHLHYYNKRALLSLFAAISEKGYDADEILQARIMSKQEAIAYRLFDNPNVAKRFFYEKYNVLPAKKSDTPEVVETVGAVLERNQEAITEALNELMNADDSFAFDASQKPIKKQRKRNLAPKTTSNKKSKTKQQNKKGKSSKQNNFEF